MSIGRLKIALIIVMWPKIASKLKDYGPRKLVFSDSKTGGDLISIFISFCTLYTLVGAENDV